MIAAETIRRLAWCAANTYYRAPLGSRILKDACGQIRGYALVDDDAVTVAIAGTKSVHDCRKDGDVRKEHHSGGMVHKGFWTEFESFRATLAAIFMANSEKVVRICGHSLGGALGVYAAADAAALKREVELVTLGCPEPGDAAFARFFRKLGIKHTRIVHAYDLVPHVPVFGFCHTSRGTVLDDEGRRLGAARGLGHWIRKLARIFWAWIRLRPISDHHVLYYLKPVDLFCDGLLKGGDHGNPGA